jgi:hypothetical protein
MLYDYSKEVADLIHNRDKRQTAGAAQDDLDEFHLLTMIPAQL